MKSKRNKDIAGDTTTAMDVTTLNGINPNPVKPVAAAAVSSSGAGNKKQDATAGKKRSISEANTTDEHDDENDKERATKAATKRVDDASASKTIRERFTQQLLQPSSSESYQGITVSVSLGPPPLITNEWNLPNEQACLLEPGCTVYLQTSLQNNNDTSKMEPISMTTDPPNPSPEWCRTENLVILAQQKIVPEIQRLCAKHHDQHRVKQHVQRLILDEQDTLKDMVAAAECYHQHSKTATTTSDAGSPAAGLGQPDVRRPLEVEWWADTTLQGLSLLRRLAGGLDFIVISPPPPATSHSMIIDDSVPAPEHVRPWMVQGGTRVATIDLSFLDVLLQCDILHQLVIHAMVRRLVKLERLIRSFDAEAAASSTSKQRCVLLQQRLMQILNRSKGTFRLADQQDLDLANLNATHLPLLCNQFPVVTDKKRWNPWSFSGRANEEMLKLEEERKCVANDYEHRMLYERNRRKAKRVGRLQDGTFLYTADDMPLRDFVDRAMFMQRVNLSIERSFLPNISRPLLKQLNLSKSTLQELQQLFFNPDGSLRQEVAPDVDLSRKHGYINFSNAQCAEPRNDKRWQVPLRQHSPVMGRVPSRRTVESILTREGVINPKFEVIHDLGILIGGTEDQSLHHDIARQTTMWVTTRPSVDSVLDSYSPVTGWEIDRLEYNEAMSSSCAPCSVLLSLGDSDLVRIGVQRGQITRCGPDRKKCSVIHGVPGEELDIIRENDYLVVVSARGCVFTGDFPHAGVQNFAPDSEEAELMKDLIQKVDAILAKYPKSHMAGIKAVVNVLCNFPGLNKLCRMHCSTELLDADMRIPRNAIGFFGCYANPPFDESDQSKSASETPAPGP